MNSASRRTYPPTLPSLRPDAAFWARVAWRVVARRVFEALKSPARLVIVGLGLALLGLSMRRRHIVAADAEGGVLVAAAFGAAFIAGLRSWWRHLGQRAEDSTWIALGGDPRGPALAVIVRLAVTSFVALAATAFAMLQADRLAWIAAWWASTLTLWWAACLAIGGMVHRITRTPAPWAAWQGATSLVTSGAALWSCATLLARARPPHISAIVAVLAAVGEAAIAVPVLLNHSRVRVSLAERSSGVGPSHAARVPDKPSEFVGLRKISALVMLRSMSGGLVQILGFAALSGAIVLGVRRLEGSLPAAIASAALLIVLLCSLAAQYRRSIGKQHQFLFMHRPPPSSRLWTAMAQGQCFVAAAAAFAAASLLLLPTWPPETSLTVWIPLATEWGIYLVLAAYVFSPVPWRDGAAQILGLVVIGGGSLLLALAKGVLFAALLTRWSVPLQSLITVYVVIRLAANAPHYLNSPRAAFLQRA